MVDDVLIQVVNPKKYVLGVFDPRHYYASSRPPKDTSLRGNTHVDILIVKSVNCGDLHAC